MERNDLQKRGLRGMHRWLEETNYLVLRQLIPYRCARRFKNRRAAQDFQPE
jgi:hypothetical protein